LNISLTLSQKNVICSKNSFILDHQNNYVRRLNRRFKPIANILKLFALSATFNNNYFDFFKIEIERYFRLNYLLKMAQM